MSSREDILAKVRKILDRAEGTDHQGEIDTALAMAAKLMAQHAIEQAEVDAMRDSGEPEKIIERVVIVGAKQSPIAHAKGNLSVPVAENNRCRVFRSSRWDNERLCYALHIIGYESDVDFAEMLWTSLCLQMEQAHDKAKAERRDWVSARTFRTSFYRGFAREAQQRLRRFAQMAKDDIEQEMGTGSALVLVDRNRAVDDYMRENHGRLRRSRRSYSGKSSHDYHAAGMGQSAAASADYSGGKRARVGYRQALEA